MCTSSLILFSSGKWGAQFSHCLVSADCAAADAFLLDTSYGFSPANLLKARPCSVRENCYVNWIEDGINCDSNFDSPPIAEGRPYTIGNMGFLLAEVEEERGAYGEIAQGDTSMSWCSRDETKGAKEERSDFTIVELSPADAAQAATAWTHAGFHEHASIASFSRFSLQLMVSGEERESERASVRASERASEREREK